MCVCFIWSGWKQLPLIRPPFRKSVPEWHLKGKTSRLHFHIKLLQETVGCDSKKERKIDVLSAFPLSRSPNCRHRNVVLPYCRLQHRQWWGNGFSHLSLELRFQGKKLRGFGCKQTRSAHGPDPAALPGVRAGHGGRRRDSHGWRASKETKCGKVHER